MDNETGLERTQQRYACTKRGWVKLLSWFFSMLAWTVLVSKHDYDSLSQRSFTCFTMVMIWLLSMFFYLLRSCGVGFVINRETFIEVVYTGIFSFFSFIAAICITTTKCVITDPNAQVQKYSCIGQYEACSVFSWFVFLLLVWDLCLAIKLRNGAYCWQR